MTPDELHARALRVIRRRCPHWPADVAAAMADPCRRALILGCAASIARRRQATGTTTTTRFDGKLAAAGGLMED